MDAKSVERLETELKEAIAKAIVRSGLKGFPLPPSDHTLTMMSKAAAAVYEAVLDQGKRLD